MEKRTVGHRIHGRIEVFAFADSIAEALALEGALKGVPSAAAYQPAPEPPDESQLPPQAFADEIVPEPMAHDEAVNR